MPLMVVPAGLGAGFGVALEELDGGGVAEPEVPGLDAEELADPTGTEFDAAASAGGLEPVPPHPAITTEIVPKKAALHTKRGTERISQF
jgi:hypothetical protein